MKHQNYQLCPDLRTKHYLSKYWAKLQCKNGHRETKGHLFKCDVTPEVPSGIFKELVNRKTSQSLHHFHPCHCPCSKGQVLKATHLNNRNEWKVKRKFSRQSCCPCLVILVLLSGEHSAPSQHLQRGTPATFQLGQKG